MTCAIKYDLTLLQIDGYFFILRQTIHGHSHAHARKKKKTDDGTIFWTRLQTEFSVLDCLWRCRLGDVCEAHVVSSTKHNIVVRYSIQSERNQYNLSSRHFRWASTLFFRFLTAGCILICIEVWQSSVDCMSFSSFESTMQLFWTKGQQAQVVNPFRFPLTFPWKFVYSQLPKDCGLWFTDCP